MEGKITEAALILPALYLMTKHNGAISTSALIKGLTDIMHPTGEDIRILNDRNDTHFSQIVRNLKSHDTFERNGFACYERIENKKNGVFRITASGLQYLNENKDVLDFLLSDNFSYEDTVDTLAQIESKPEKKKIDLFDEDIEIREGEKKSSTSSRYDRSAKLREYARNAFTVNGQISCACCGFNFSKFYGRELGTNYIEIHHIKPVFKYEDEDMDKTMKSALANLIPLCSNCHRIIHRDRKKPLSIEALKEAIENACMMHTFPILTS